MSKPKILFLSMYSPFPMNYGGKVGTVSILKMLNKYFDVYLFGLLEKDDIVDETSLLTVCKKYKFYPRNKCISDVFKSMFMSYQLISRLNNDLINDISEYLFSENIRIIFCDCFLMYETLKRISGDYFIILNEQNIEFLSLSSNGDAKNFPINLIYKYQSILLKKRELKIGGNNKIKGITFASFSDQRRFCDLSGFDIKKTMYLPPVYDFKEAIKLDVKDNYYDCLIVANFKYPPNIYGLRWFLDECLPFIEKERPNLKITIIGRGLFDSFDKEELLKRKCLNPIGEVEDVAPYYRGTKVVLIPLFHGGGVKIKLLEAVSYNKCVVCTSKATEGTRFDKDSLFVSDSPKEIVGCLYNALDNEELRNLKIEKATEILKNDFDADIVSKRLFDFIVEKGAM